MDSDFCRITSYTTRSALDCRWKKRKQEKLSFWHSRHCGRKPHDHSRVFRLMVSMSFRQEHNTKRILTFKKVSVRDNRDVYREDME